MGYGYGTVQLRLSDLGGSKMSKQDRVVRAAFRAEVESRGTGGHRAKMKSFKKAVKKARRG